MTSPNLPRLISILLQAARRQGGIQTFWLAIAAILGLASCSREGLYRPITEGDIGKVRALIQAQPELVSERKSDEATTPLHWAVKLRDRHEIIQALLDAKADVNAKNADGESALHLAVQANQANYVRLLLANHADPNVTDNNGEVPLMRIGKDADALEIIDLLVEGGANVDARDKMGCTLLFNTSLAPAILERLLVKKADPNARSNKGRTPLHVHAAAAYGGALDDTASVRILLAHGADPNARYEAGTPLHEACMYSSTPRVVQFLLDHGADINAKDDGGNTPLHVTLEEKIVPLLLAKKADINAVNNNGETPIHHTPSGPVVEALLKNGADIHAKDNKGGSALHSAAKKGYKETMVVLLKHNADPKSRDLEGNTPLLVSSELAITKLLLENNADLEDECIDGHTALHHAALAGKGDILEFLIARKANIEARDSKGCTPLHLAAANGRLEAATALIASNAQVNSKDANLATPLFFAVYGNEKEVAKILLAHKAEVDARDNQGRTALHFAAALGFTDVAKILLTAKADVNAEDNKGRTPIFESIDGTAKDPTETASLLLDQGAEVNHIAKADNITPLKLATEAGRQDCIALLKRHGAHL